MGFHDTTSSHADPHDRLTDAHAGDDRMSSQTIRPRNQLLACLPEADWLRLMPC
jgi:hypothetical protein